MGNRMNLARLGEEVSRSLESARTASGGASRVRAKIVARAPARTRHANASAKPRLRYGRIAAAVAMVAMMVLGIGLATMKRELTFSVAENEKGVVGAFIAAPPSGDVPLSFSDGTRVVLAPSTRARVASITPKGARLLVESGALHADVVHTGDANWAVEAGPFEVRVTGTSFDVTWDPKEQSIVVALTEGSVVVTGCTLGEGKRVVRGERIHASCKESTAASSPPDAVPAAPAPAMTPESLPDAPATPTSAIASPLAKPLASAAPPASVAAVMPAAAAKTATTPEQTAAELLAAAVAARYEGDFDRATQTLDTVRRRFGGSDSAAKAAFELGRIAFDARRDFVAAGDWFDTYLRERPNGALAREALGRALEARHRAGDATQAERLAVRYLGAYPNGPHAKLAKKIATPRDGAQNR